ncbi:plasma membrane calcium-transporting ATPase [Aspergillus niger]|uniref:Calcium-transporting ATPase n=1 Tax=Aspergillus niger TaxID=5061 RepID=A0A117E1E9_ASPNG|nr:plasma membrane calcium-transporting ATPase [Aspergillus niger]
MDAGDFRLAPPTCPPSALFLCKQPYRSHLTLFEPYLTVFAKRPRAPYNFGEKLEGDKSLPTYLLRDAQLLNGTFLVHHFMMTPFKNTQESGTPSLLASVRHTLEVTFLSSYTNVLLIFVFLGILSGSQEWNPSAVFILNFLAIFPLASLLSFATEELAKSVGQTVGGLINASFGNAIEMIVGITAVSQGEIHMVQSSMVGSILSGTLLVLGCCFFASGYDKETVYFNVDVTGIMSSLMIVSSSALIIPSTLYSTSLYASPGGNEYILHLSHITAALLLLFYFVYLYFQLSSHSHLFTSTEDDEEEEERQLGPMAASIILIAATLGVTVCSDYLVEGVDGFVEAYGVSRAFLGLIVVPIVGNAGEFATTVKAAKEGKVDLAIGVIVGSTLQIALFVTPFLVLYGWALGQPMSLRFNSFETACFSLAVVVMNCLIREGRSNYFAGSLSEKPVIAHGPLVRGEPSAFEFSAEQLSGLIESRSLDTFYTFGGLRGLERGLRTDRNTGLSVDESSVRNHEPSATASSVDKPSHQPHHRHIHLHHHHGTEQFADRRAVFGNNRLPVPKSPTVLQLIWAAYNDHVLFLLTGAAIISLALGLYQTFGTKHSSSNPPVEWVEGVAIIVAIIVIVLVGAGNDFQKELQFQKLNKKKQDRLVRVIRSGRPQEVPINDLVVGDVVHMEPGDVIPADGILIRGHHIRCDESAATGESDLLLKQSGDEVADAIADCRDTKYLDPFVISGSKVAEGLGSFLVIATGNHSTYGKILLSLEEDPGFTPLQSRLNVLAKYIAKFGGIAGLVLFVILFIKFLVGLRHSTSSATEKGQDFLEVFIIALTVVVIAVPEGLPLTVTLSLAFATTRMLKDNNLVRQLRACEIMGNATDICSDKTGTLTQNKMTVVAGIIGTEEFSDLGLQTDAPSRDVPTTAVLKSRLHNYVKSLIVNAVAYNTTAFESIADGNVTFVGSKTEAALLYFARDNMGLGPLELTRSGYEVVELIPFDARRKCMITVVCLEDVNGYKLYRAYIKGAPEVLMGFCNRTLVEPTKGDSVAALTASTKEAIRQKVEAYSKWSLRAIALCYRDFEVWPPNRAGEIQSDTLDLEDILSDLTLIGIAGIRDPLREGAHDAVETCRRAGVTVRMVTGDNLLTAQSIAEECAIVTNNEDIVMEGQEFRRLTEEEQLEIAPRLKVLARSQPEDKRTLVRRLKQIGATVAVTGDGTNDAPALKAADVGFSMGISGTEIAREASAIVLMDDNFGSIVKAIMWGRAVSDAVQKFLQFQITITFTSVGLAFVTSAASSSETSVLTAVQLMWVNLIQDTLAALALATDPPFPRVLDRTPDKRTTPLITVPMWKMIIGQSIYQLAVTLVLHFAGNSIFSYTTAHEHSQLQTAVFNTYVWMQIFNLYNTRALGNNINVFEGIHRNWLFIGVNVIMIGGQIIIMFVGGRAFSITRLTGVQWAYSVVLGVLSLLVGVIVRFIPDSLVERLFAGVGFVMGPLWRLLRMKIE